MKLWDKGFNVNKAIEAFTIGNDNVLDLELAPYDVLGTMAHITMLAEVGLLEKKELPKLKKELKKIYITALKGMFTIEPVVEDVNKKV